MLLNKRSFEFGEFLLQADKKILLRQDKPVPLTPKAIQLLLVLVENHGQVVSKEELMQIVWTDSFVEESNLTFTVSLLRKALGEDKQNLKFIETIPKRGYRFVSDVREIIEQNEVKIQNSDSTKPKKYLIPAVLVILLIGIITIAWYAGNGRLRKAAPILSEPFSLEKISTDGNVANAVISPDGKMVVYSSATAGDNQSIWLRQLDSGTNVELIPPSSFSYNGFAFSPDGTFVYFHRRSLVTGEGPNIYRVSIFGGIPQKIIERSTSQVSFSPDGAKVSFVRCDNTQQDEYCSIWMADAKDGSNEKKIAVSSNPNRISSQTFSPDGKSIVYAIGQSNNAANEFSLVELNIETGIEREFTSEKFFDIRKIVWLPDKSGLLITASRIPNRNFRLWSVSRTESVPLTKDSESYHALSLNNGANLIVSTHVKPDFQLKIFRTDNPSFPGSILANATSASFVENDKILFSSAMTGNEEIWSIQKDGTEKRQLTNNPADETTPIISPNGNSIFFTSNRTGQAQIWRMNRDGTNQTQITQTEGGFPLYVSPDGKWVYYRSGVKKNLWRVSTEGHSEQLVRDRRSFTPAFSSDGSQVAYLSNNQEKGVIEILSLSNWQILKSFPLAAGKSGALRLMWSDNGKSLFYLVSDSNYKNNALWKQSLNSTPPQKIADLGDELIEAINIAPDGKSFVIVQGSWKYDAVLLKGLK
ncbi:MAG TPA: winged helix-turn-helix domain-containing protein [Pyrinomonadaceae bacterium]|nr:winged helix-turn-helix domain-containing protein [Pyrinomonadaceae bacterium]